MKQNGRGRGHGYSNYGPLMTNHLQVKNLDRELELLRRKREVIQQEQQMLLNIDRKRQYEQNNRNVSNMYGNVWQPSPPKRANAPQPANPWMSANSNNFGPSLSKPMPSNYIPSLLSKKIDPPLIPIALKPIVHPILKNAVSQNLLGPVKVREDFHPTQVTKKKPRDFPNKLNSYPINVRKDLISIAAESQLVHNKAPENSHPMILCENEIPNKQVNGRLELALGGIVKEIRCSNNQNETFKKLISTPMHQRTLKQTIRERLRNIMLNKTVGSVSDIVKQYREKFNKRSDKDIVESIINSQHVKTANFIETENPEEYFKKSIDSIFEKKIQEMSSNLLKLYSNVRRKSAIANTKTMDDAARKQEISARRESILNDENATKILRSITGKYVTTEEKDVLNNYYSKLIEDIIEEKLPEYLPKCTETFTKIFDLDHRFKNIKMIAVKQVQAELMSKKIETATLQRQNETDTKTSDKEETQLTEISHNNATEGELDTESNILEGKKEIKGNATIENKDQETVDLDNAMEAVAKDNNTNEDTSTENLSGKTITAESDKAEVVALAIPSPIQVEESTSTPNPETLISNVTQASPTTIIKPTTSMANETKLSSTTLKAPVTVCTSLAKEISYYVKIIGRPSLPDRAMICDFLNKYKPNSIKKHKSINNLLVVGFTNKEDYNKILTANQTVIGDATMIIKPSEKVIPGKQKDSTTVAPEAIKETEKEINNADNYQKETEDGDKTELKLKQENETCNQSADNSEGGIENELKDIIGKELDDQINDLLSNIKKADEEAKNISQAPSLEPIQEVDVEPIQEVDVEPIQEVDVKQIKEIDVKDSETRESDKTDKITKVNVKESGRATPIRSSSRLGNVTPSTIRTRRASRLMQE